jgi:hypothetical protein
MGRGSLIVVLGAFATTRSDPDLLRRGAAAATIPVWREVQLGRDIR